MIQPPDSTSPGPIEDAPSPAGSRGPRLGLLGVGAVMCVVGLIAGLVLGAGESGSSAAGSDQTAVAATSTTTSQEPNDPASFGYATVPDLTGMTGDEASAALDTADFRDISFTTNYASMDSFVEWQSPAAGTWWSKTSSVRVTLDPTSARSTASSATMASTPAPTAPTTSYVEPSSTYTYKITGKNSAMITYSSTGGNTSQVSSAELPWSKSVESPGYSGMSFAYVSAQNSGGGTISCQIIGPSGNVISENSSEGAYAIVTCQD